MGDAGLGQGDLGDFTCHRFGAIECGAIGQLHHADQISLVLRRDKAAGDDLEHQVGGAGEDGVEAEHQGLAADQAADGLAISVRAALEQLVEAIEEAAERGVHGAG